MKIVSEKIKRTDWTPDYALSFHGQCRFPLYDSKLGRIEYDVIYREAK